MSSRTALVLFLVIVIGGGLAIGSVTVPGGWYQALEKPPFNPPNWIFGPVWTILYVFIAVAGWRVWRRDPQGPALKVWVLQLLLNFAWSPTFFRLHQVGLALAIVAALLVSILVFIALARRVDRPAAWLFVPYAAWVAFATLLNGSILVLN
jgi:tryptophan-rich sensory protein